MKILIIHTFGLGDMIMFTPALQKLIEMYPSAKIDFLIFQKISSFPIKNLENLNNIYYTDFNIKSILKTLYQIRKNQYDISIVTSGTNPLKSGLFSFFIKSKLKIGEYKKDYQKIFFDIPIKYIENLHRVENNYLLVTKGKEEDIKFHPKIFGLEVKKSKNKNITIGIHPGSNPKFNFRRWEKEKFVELINLLKKYNKKLEFIIFVGPGEREEGKYIAEETNSILYIDKSLREVSEKIGKCDIFINTDSGLGHIASCFEYLEIFTIFGPAKDYKTKPYNKNAFVVKKGLECQPCYGTNKMNYCNLECLKYLTSKEVLEFIINNSKLLKKDVL